uniref:Uncharacterized protein n=1 Tax=Anguilla anguilla TaxID=7936 RepID=A0A0E9UV39_ANGAN
MLTRPLIRFVFVPGYLCVCVCSAAHNIVLSKNNNQMKITICS